MATSFQRWTCLKLAIGYLNVNHFFETKWHSNSLFEQFKVLLFIFHPSFFNWEVPGARWKTFGQTAPASIQYSDFQYSDRCSCSCQNTKTQSKEFIVPHCVDSLHPWTRWKLECSLESLYILHVSVVRCALTLSSAPLIYPFSLHLYVTQRLHSSWCIKKMRTRNLTFSKSWILQGSHRFLFRFDWICGQKGRWKFDFFLAVNSLIWIIV